MAKPQRRTTQRLARLRTENPQALKRIKADNRYTPRERQQVRDAIHTLSAKQREQRKARANKPEPYNPLAPLTGKREKQEREAATRLEFGEREKALREATAQQAQSAVNTGSYYDDWRKALEASRGRIEAENAASVAAAEGRVDTAYAQDKAAVEARDKASAESSQARGITPTASSEGARAVEAQRSQGNQAISEQRRQASADKALVESRSTTSLQAKAEALAREENRRRKLEGEDQALAKEKGDFQVDFRRRNREAERSYALASKEFGLKEAELSAKNAGAEANRRVERQKLATQKLVAKLYSDADKAKARATIRVARLQLQKGKIDQHQFNTIRNIYEGLPAKGKSGSPKSDGSGVGGELQNWERDKIDLAVRSLKSARATPDEKAQMIDSLVKRGNIPARLARIAWGRYIRGRHTSRPDTAGNSGIR